MTGSYNKKTRLLLHTRQQSVRFQCFSVVLCGDQIHTGTGRKESWKRDTEGVWQWGAKEETCA
jgi:hypothetical protein